MADPTLTAPTLGYGPSKHYKGVQLIGIENYSIWKIMMVSYLDRNQLLRYTDRSSTNEDQGNREAKAVFDELLCSISPSLLASFTTCTNARDFLQAVLAKFEDHSATHVNALRSHLQRIKLLEGGDLYAFLEKFMTIAKELRQVDAHVSEVDIIQTCITNMKTHRYEPVLQVMMMNMAGLTIDLFADRLKTYEEHLIMRFGRGKVKRTDTRDSDQLLFAGDYSRSQSKSMVRCFRCHKRGHLSRDCRWKGRNDTRQYNHQDSAHDEMALSVEEEKHHDSDICYLDSGASRHMTGFKHLLHNYQDLQDPVEVITANGTKISGIGQGDMQKGQLKMKDVLYVPKLKTSLFSVSAATEKGAKISFGSEFAFATVDGEEFQLGIRQGRSYALKIEVPEKAAVIDRELLHKRLGHLNYRSLEDMVKGGAVHGVSLSGAKPEVCEGCATAKLHQTSFGTKLESREALAVNDLVHSDVVGPMKTHSFSGKRFVIFFIDDFSRHVSAHYLATKGEAFEAFKEYKQMVEVQHQRPIRRFRTDNGGEYTSANFRSFLKKFGIKHELTVARRPQQNGVAERFNRTVVEMARSMLLSSKLCGAYWAEAVQTAVFIRNRCTSSSLPKNQTPFQLWTGRKPSIRFLRTFGCKVWYKNDDAGKFERRGKQGIFIGYPTNKKGYRIKDEITNKVIVSRDVIFQEGVQSIQDEDDEVIQTRKNQEVISRPKLDPRTVLPRRSSRFKNPKPKAVRFADEQTLFCLICQENDDPKNRVEALKDKDANEWKNAMTKEYQALIKNNMWTIVPRPEDRKVIDSRWVFKRKKDQNNKVVKFKARFVARGFTQVFGCDYMETYSPVARASSIRTLLSVAASKDLELFQLDIETAFQHQDLQEEIFMEQPAGFIQSGTTFKSHVCKLHKVLYGLKQGAVELHKHLLEVLDRHGYRSSAVDKCVISKVYPDGGYIICAVHVDDFLCACTSLELYSKFKQDLSEVFPVKDLGKAKFLLGMHLTRNHTEKIITLSQKAKIDKMLKIFGMDESKPVKTPFGGVMTASDDEQLESDDFPFREAVGHLMYLANMTRPDISFAVGFVARAVSNYTMRHVKLVKRILRYLKGTSTFGICFQGQNQGKIDVYCDADFAGDSSDRKSISGGVILHNGGPVTFYSKKQGCVSRSTAEAEYVSLSEITAEALWFNQLLGSFPEQIIMRPIIVNEDNQACISIAEQTTSTKRSKYIDIHYHYVRDHVNKMDIKLQFCPTESMIADIFTKELGSIRFCLLRDKIGVFDTDILLSKGGDCLK